MGRAINRYTENECMVDNIDNDKAQIDRAVAMRDNRDFDGAIAIYTQLLTKYPRSVLYFERGTTYSERGDFSEAILDLTKAIELDSIDMEAYVNRANAYSQLGQCDAAIRDYNKAIQLLTPTLAYAYNGRGAAYRKTGRTEEATDDFELASQLDSSYISPHYNLAEVCFANDQFDESLAYLDRARQIDPDDARIQVLRGEVHAALENRKRRQNPKNDTTTSTD